MFGLERHMGFIQSLVTERAGQFSERITNNLSRATGNFGGNIPGAGEIAENAIRQVPDMILPEDAGDVGNQIMGEVRNFAPEQALGNATQQANDAFSRTRAIAGDITRAIPDAGDLPGNRDLLPTQEIMRRRLNHFQIERLAEQIKDRLESEMKVDRERHGEEP